MALIKQIVKPYFGTETQTLEEEIRHKEIFKISQYTPKYWVARWSHNLMSGDLRIFKLNDEILEKWIYESFDLIDNCDLEELQKQTLTEKRT